MSSRPLGSLFHSWRTIHLLLHSGAPPPLIPLGVMGNGSGPLVFSSGEAKWRINVNPELSASGLAGTGATALETLLPLLSCQSNPDGSFVLRLGAAQFLLHWLLGVRAGGDRAEFLGPAGVGLCFTGACTWSPSGGRLRGELTSRYSTFG